MKKLFILTTLCVINFSTVVLAQERKWFLPAYNVDMTTASPSTTSAPVTYSPATKYKDADALYNASGSSLFYILNQSVYDASGTYAFDLPGYWDPSLNTLGGCLDPTLLYLHKDVNTGELNIVGVPGECSKYYVIYVLRANAIGSNVIVYTIIDVSSGSPVLNSAGYTDVAFTGCGTHRNAILIDNVGLSTNTELAVSKRISGGNRYLFAACDGNSSGTLIAGIYRYTISSSAIGTRSTIMGPSVNNTTYSIAAQDFSARDMDLSPNQQYLCWASGDPTASSTNYNCYQISLSSYAYSSVRRISSGVAVNGLEYDANSTNIFASGASGVYWGAASTATSFPSFITGSNNHNNSNLELASNGKIVAVNSTTTNISYISTSGTTTTSVASPSNDGPDLTYYRLPNQIDGEDYFGFTGVQTAYSTITVNGTAAVACATPQQVYTCQTITLANTLTGTVSSYRLEIKSMSACGTYTSGGGALGTYSSGSQASFSTISDLKNEPGTNGTWLSNSAHAGLYEVNLYTTNSCGVETVTTTYLNLSGPPSAASINLTMNSGGVMCAGATLGAKCSVGDNAGSYNYGSAGATYGSLNITSVARKIEQVNCTTGALITTVLNESMTPVTPTSGVSGLVLNDIVIGGSTGYFVGKDGNCYKFTVSVQNACGTPASDISYFKLDPIYFRPAGISSVNESGDDFYLTENPVQQNAVFTVIVSEEKTVSCSITDLTGKTIVSKSIVGSKGTNYMNIETSSLPSGIYYYSALIGDKKVTGRFIKN